MSVNSIVNTGLQGVHAGIALSDQAARQLSGLGKNSDVNAVATSLVDLKIGEIQVRASASVLKTADQILGTIIDVSA
ncbi:MAG: hypothetical protein WA632_04850 [Gallionella sp.]